MRRIVLQVAVSLDGYIEGPQGEYDWCFMDQDYGMSDFTKTIDTIFMGRKTYELMKDMPINPDDPMMAAWAHISTFVFSNSPGIGVDETKYNWVTGDTIAWIKEYKQNEGKDIWLFGGALFTAFLIQNHLVDELQLAVHPVLLGGGKSFIQHIDHRLSLKLIDTKVYNTGLVMMKYGL